VKREHLPIGSQHDIGFDAIDRALERPLQRGAAGLGTVGPAQSVGEDRRAGSHVLSRPLAPVVVPAEVVLDTTQGACHGGGSGGSGREPSPEAGAPLSRDSGDLASAPVLLLAGRRAP